MAYKIFVDGQAGTTGLKINERLSQRKDIEILSIPGEKRKDLQERKKYINDADIVFLCLPDDAAREAAALVDNKTTRVIDASTAHRTAPGWVYGLPELSGEQRALVKAADRVANPGCYATGFNLLMHPLIKSGILPVDYQASCYAISGYSGGGNKLIGQFEGPDTPAHLNSPCFYALELKHKHLPEMKAVSGLEKDPLFMPVVAGYYQGMVVTAPLMANAMKKYNSRKELHQFYTDYYGGSNFLNVMPLAMEACLDSGFLGATKLNGTNNIEIFVLGNEDQLLLAARLDNLGKGASGAAVQNMNIMLGMDEREGLV